MCWDCIKQLRLSRKICLWWDERQAQKEFLVKLEEAKKKGDKDRVEELNYQYWWDLEEIRAHRRFLMQEKALRKAERLGLPIPVQEAEKIRSGAEDENWYFCAPAGEWLLKDKALTDLRREIRKEKKEKIDLFMPPVSLLIALFGSVASVLGALLAWWAWSSK
jgi:hypothetical protein